MFCVTLWISLGSPIRGEEGGAFPGTSPHTSHPWPPKLFFTSPKHQTQNLSLYMPTSSSGVVCHNKIWIFCCPLCLLCPLCSVPSFLSHACKGQGMMSSLKELVRIKSNSGFRLFARVLGKKMHLSVAGEFFLKGYLLVLAVGLQWWEAVGWFRPTTGSLRGHQLIRYEK